MNIDNLNIILIHQHKTEEYMKVLQSFFLDETPNRRTKRLRTCIKLAKLLKIRKEILDEIEKLSTQRSIWTKVRTSTFWEEEIVQNSNEHFKQHFRMSRDTFEVLCNELKILEKNDTHYRKCIPLRKRVAIAVYTLGSSAEYRTISALFGVGVSTVFIIVKSFCQAVWRVLHPKYLCAYPLTSDSIKENVDGFQKLGFPQCFGAIDGCHIEIQPPSQDAVDYYNYKGWYSMVLLAVVDYR